MGTLISSVAAIVVALIGVIVSGRKTDAKVEHCKDTVDKNEKLLSVEHQGISDSVKKLENTATFLKEDTIRRNAEQAALSKQEPNIGQVLHQVNALGEKIGRLEAENAQLRADNQQLRQQRDKQQAYRQEQNDELER